MILGSRNVGSRWTGRLGAVALIALAITPTATRAMDLFVRGVRDGQPAFGVVEIDVEVLSLEPIDRVELVVDGASVGELRSPPYRWQVDLGEENRGHAFEVTVEDASGAVETRLVETPPILVHQALDLGLQQLYATVTRDGRRILDLDREAFEVRDDGVPQTLVTFEGGDVPFTAVLLVDTSTSMRGDQLSTAISGARGFVARMRELDQAQVILFSDRVVAESPFTGDPEAITAALQGARAAGGTAVNDHLYLALKRLEARQGRRVIVLLGDGRDIESVLTMDDVAWKAGRVQPLVYWIRPRPEGRVPDLVGLARSRRSRRGARRPRHAGRKQWWSDFTTSTARKRPAPRSVPCSKSCASSTSSATTPPSSEAPVPGIGSGSGPPGAGSGCGSATATSSPEKPEAQVGRKTFGSGWNLPRFPGVL